jgi:hypothetical protein
MKKIWEKLSIKTTLQKLGWGGALIGLGLAMLVLPTRGTAQDQYDPPGRVGRIGYLQGAVSFLSAGESEWVGAVPNRPLTTGDQLWTDRGSRAEVQLGSAVIRLAPSTGFSFLNLDDDTVQVRLSSGAINVTVRRLDNNDDFEIDTPNQAFTIFQPGHYRVEASTDGNSTAISVRAGNGEATGYGQTYRLQAGQRGTFSGTDSLYADVEPIERGDDFDTWSDGRDHRYDSSRSAQYLSRDTVGYDDLDDYGDWRDDPNYGHVWYPTRVETGWAPYREGHWDWVAPWGWTWVDDSSWGYAPFHYGRWVSVGGRWGWVAGPVTLHAVYAPALGVFVGGGGGGFGGNVGWFPLGPREVYVPSYHVSEGYVNRVNVSNTTVNVTQVTNIYNTTIVRNTTNITNVTYVNRNIQGAVTAVPQRAFVSAEPVARAAVAVNARDIAAASVSSRVAVAPTQASVMGARGGTANVAAPPAAIANRQVVAKKTPPAPPVPFASQQQTLAAHPGQPLARSEMQNLRPTNTAAARPMVKQAPPGKPTTPTMGHSANQPGANQPGGNQPMNRPGNQPVNNQPAIPPGNQPPATERQENRGVPAQPQPNNRQEMNAPVNRPDTRPRPPEPNRVPQPNNRPSDNRPSDNRPPAPGKNPVQPNRNEQLQRTPAPPAPNNRPEVNAPVNRPETTPRPPERTAPPPAARPAPPPPQQQTPGQKKQQEDRQKRDEKPPGE